MPSHEHHPHDDLERRLTAALGRRAALAPDAEQVRSAALATASRRRRRRRTTAVAAALALAGVGVAAPLLHDVVRPAVVGTTAAGRPPAPTADDAGAGAAPSVEGPTPSAEDTLPWSLPEDDASAGATSEPPGPAGGEDARELVRAFTGAGHTAEEALELARLWQEPSGYRAAQRAGREILAGQPLPALGDTVPEDSTGVDPRARAFLDAGYDYPDAQELAALWGLPDPYQAKVAAGSNMLSGHPVPLVDGS